MRIRPNERQHIVDILHEELDEANRRITERLAQFECVPASSKEDKFDAIRSFYVDLVDKEWTDADEEALSSLGDMSEAEIKQLMREAFRRSRVYPVPNLAALLNVIRKGDGDQQNLAAISRSNPDAVSAIERERIANLLHDELAEAAQEIARRLMLADAKVEIVREQLEIVEGQVISRFTPLV